jgi:hypothetical protein
MVMEMEINGSMELVPVDRSVSFVSMPTVRFAGAVKSVKIR